MNLLAVNRPISDSPKKKPSFYKLRLASAASAATSSLTSGKRSVSMDVNFGHNTSATSKGKLRYEEHTSSPGVFLVVFPRTLVRVFFPETLSLAKNSLGLEKNSLSLEKNSLSLEKIP